jgi:hypothetical protein
MTSSSREPNFKPETVVIYKLPLFMSTCEFNEEKKINAKENKEGGKNLKHNTFKHHSNDNLQQLILKKRQSLYSSLNKISDYAPVLYRYLIKNVKHVHLYNIKQILSSYLEEVNIDYHKAIKKNITVDNDWIQLYNSLL